MCAANFCHCSVQKVVFLQLLCNCTNVAISLQPALTTSSLCSVCLQDFWMHLGIYRPFRTLGDFYPNMSASSAVVYLNQSALKHHLELLLFQLPLPGIFWLLAYFFLLILKRYFLCITLVALELTQYTRLSMNSEISLPLCKWRLRLRCLAAQAWIITQNLY